MQIQNMYQWHTQRIFAHISFTRHMMNNWRQYRINDSSVQALAQRYDGYNNDHSGD